MLKKIIAIFILTTSPIVLLASTSTSDGSSSVVSKLFVLASFTDWNTIVILKAYSLASVLLIGVVTSVLVFINSRKMKGGLFGTALAHLSVGMFLVLVGYVIMSVASFVPETGEAVVYAKVLQDIFFVLGYIIMAVAGHKLFKFTRVQ